MALLGIVFLCQHKIGQANIGSVGQQKGIEIDWVSLASCYSIALKEKKPMAKLSAIMNCFFFRFLIVERRFWGSSFFLAPHQSIPFIIFTFAIYFFQPWGFVWPWQLSHNLFGFSTLGFCLAIPVIP